MAEPRVIELTEYATATFAAEDLPQKVGEVLWRDYAAQVNVVPPSFKTDNYWRLTAQGWVGYIPVTDEWSIALRPKVPLGNLFGMLEYAYQLKSFHILDELMPCRSLEEFYERLANILARRVLDRSRKGLYRAYVPETERLPYVRGRIDVRRAIRTPWDVALPCHFEEHTADIEENQILAWTLRTIARSGMCTERVLPTVRRAYRALRGFATLVPTSPERCTGRLYNRLNDDYHPMHALCGFFLEHSGPSHEVGERTMLPFLVDMPRLYERFVAEWLNVYLPAHLRIEAQARVYVGEGQSLYFDIDLVLRDLLSEKTLCVLDTKYKTSQSPEADDVEQIIAYAQTKGCRDAVLIYPTRLSQPWEAKSQDIRIRRLAFALDGDLEQAGEAFLADLLGRT